ncbi:MAG TPA: hypothetical protein VIW67_12560 [Terriglobales bacterium]
MKAIGLPPPVLDRIIRHVNRKLWWHVPPRDPAAYVKRGKFLASSFAEAEFWGRPLDDPQKVRISRPLIGDEATIETTLLGRVVSNDAISMERRWALDARIKKAARKRGYDSIVLVSPKAFLALKTAGKLPRSMELNILSPGGKSAGM